MLPTDYIVATPVSHYFRDAELRRRFTELSDALELRQNDIDLRAEQTQFLYHSEFDLAREWGAEQWKTLLEKYECYDPALVSFHLATRYQETRMEGDRFVGIGKPYTRSQLLEHVRENVATVREVVGDIPILIENNNHLGTDAYDVVTDAAFIDTTVRETSCGFLFDIAHAKITAHNIDTDSADYIGALPLDRCKQVHLSRHTASGERATDDHNFLRAADWAYAEDLTRRLPALEYVTLEYYRDVRVLEAQLERMQTGSSDGVLAKESWDSEFFGKAIASVRCEPTPSECFDYAVVRGLETNLDCLYFETRDTEERDAARARGFDLVDTRIVFSQSITDRCPQATPDGVRRWQRDDVATLRSIARSIFTATRFFTDERFDEERCRDLYATWIENACEGYADEVFVATNDDKPVGFVTCPVDDETGSIGLIGVSADVEGRGLGENLVQTALDYFTQRGVRTVTVETQIENEPALALYEKTGFYCVGIRFLLHYWFDQGEQNPTAHGNS